MRAMADAAQSVVHGRTEPDGGAPLPRGMTALPSYVAAPR
jgi:hypothetical protein